MKEYETTELDFCSNPKTCSKAIVEAKTLQRVNLCIESGEGILFCCDGGSGNAKPNLQPATNPYYPTPDPANQTSKEVRHAGTQGPCSDTNCECEKRLTSRVSSSKQDKVRQGVSQVMLHFPIIKLQRTPTQKTPPLDSLNHTSSCPQRQRAASSTKLKLLLNTTDLRFRATRNYFATNAEPHLQPATNPNHSTNYITNLCNPCGSDSTDPANQTSKDVRHEGTRGPCSDTNCECEKRLTSRVSSSKQAHVRPRICRSCCKPLKPLPNLQRTLIPRGDL